MPGPLSGIKVVEVAQEIQGPYASLFLADMGADVIKVENRETGDLARRTTVGVVGGPDVPHADFAQYFFVLNRGKRSLTLDLKHPRGKEVLGRLLDDADVLLTNFRPGVLERLGFGYEEIQKRYPKLIYASASSWGPKGPWARKPARDTLAQAATGVMGKTGHEGSPPTPAGVALADYTGAVMSMAGVMAALYDRSNTGRGQRVDTSMYGSVLALQPWEIVQTSLSGRENRRAGRGHQFLHGVWGAFRTKDGWIAIAGVSDDRWPVFCELIGRPELVDDPHCDHEGRNFRGDKIQGILDELLATRSTEEWMAILEPADMFVTPVASYQDVLNSRQAEENGYIRSYDHPEVGEFKFVGNPIQLSEYGLPEIREAPKKGEHCDQVLREAGYSDEEIAALRGDQVI